MAEFPFVHSLGKKYNQDLMVIFVSADWLDEEKQVKDFLNSMDVSGQSYIKDQPDEEFIMVFMGNGLAVYLLQLCMVNYQDQ